MSHSPEYLALAALAVPVEPRAGDMWLDRRLGIVKVVNGHKRGRGKRYHLNTFHLYHWGKPDLTARPCDWRDFDLNAVGISIRDCVYVGNLFDIIPYHVLARELPGQFQPNRVEGPFP